MTSAEHPVPGVEDPLDSTYLPAQSVISGLSDSQGFFPRDNEINDTQEDVPSGNPLLQRLQQGFHGRVRELNTLKDELKNVQNGPSRAVWVSGVSGVGKTSVVTEALGIHPGSSHYFVMGKFDQTRQRCEPYSALIEALAELYDRIGQPDTRGMESKTEPGQWGGLQMHHLTEIISNLSRISLKDVAQQPTNPTDTKTSTVTTTGGKTHSFVQFKQLCRTFLSATATADHSVVLFLDDLHWADEASLMVLDALLNDGDSRHVLLVGAYREDELSGNRKLKELITNTTSPQGGVSSRSLGETATTARQGSFRNLLESLTAINGESPDGTKPDRRRQLLLRSSSKNHLWPATIIHVRPLNALALHSMIKSWTHRHNDNAETWNLSQVVWNKTHGNMYFVIQFMAMMVRKQLLVPVPVEGEEEKTDNKDEEPDRGDSPFSGKTTATGEDSTTIDDLSHCSGSGGVLSDRSYVWDIDRVQQLTNVSDNVMDHVVGNLRSLSPEIQAALVVAALLGFDIHVDLLLCVLQHVNKQHGQNGDERDTVPTILSDMSHTQWTRDELDRVLSVGRREGLIEQRSYNEDHNKSNERGGERNDDGDWSVAQYKFTHDRVPTALCALVPTGDERELLHLQVGRALLSKAVLTENTVDWLPPLAADHLNQGARRMERKDERIELIKLNLRVGKASIVKCAFVPAADYLKSARTLFDEDNLWDQHYDLGLDLFSTLAEAQHNSGHFQASKEVIDALLSRTKNVEDGLRSYLVRVEALGANGETEKGRELAFSLLRELGVVFPKKVKKWHVVVEFIKIQLAFRGQDPQSYLLGMEPMTDSKKAAAMNILSNIAAHTFMNDAEKDTFSLVGLRLMRLTVQYGLNEWSPSGIATYAIALVAVGKYTEALSFGWLATQVSDKLGTRPNEARHWLYLNLVMHWRRPFMAGMTDMLMCHDLAMQHGDIDTGLCALVNYFTTAMACMPLESLETSFRRFVQQMYEFDHQTYLGVAVPLLQYALNLLGQSDDPFVLTGEVMNYEEFREVVVNQNQALAVLSVDYLHLVLIAHCGSVLHCPERVVELVELVRLRLKVAQTHYFEYFATYMTGLCYFRLLRDKRTRRRHRYRRWGNRCTRRLDSWANKHGIVSCRPFYLHLDATRRCLQQTMFTRNQDEKRYEHLKSVLEESVGLFFEEENKLYAFVSGPCEEAAWWARINGKVDDARASLLRASSFYEEYGCVVAVQRLQREIALLGGVGFNNNNNDNDNDNDNSRPYDLAIEFEPTAPAENG